MTLDCSTVYQGHLRGALKEVGKKALNKAVFRFGLDPEVIPTH